MGDVFRKYKFSLKDVRKVSTIKDRLISLSLLIVCINNEILSENNFSLLT